MNVSISYLLLKTLKKYVFVKKITHNCTIHRCHAVKLGNNVSDV